MVTTNCKELVGGEKNNCTVPISGNNLEELKKNVFAHGEQHHAEQLKALTPQDQAHLVQRIGEIWQAKSKTAAPTR